MDQEKIGRFIAQERKRKNMTQMQLAEKLGVTDRSISKWENGKCMPDVSLFRLLCQHLDISINDLLSGERIKEEEYKNKSEENIINLTINNKKRFVRKSLIVSSCLLLIVFIYIVSIILYKTIEFSVDYDSRLMSCSFSNNQLKYEIKGISVLNTNYIQRIIDNKKYYIFQSTISLYNKRRSHWEYRESLAESISNKRVPFGAFYEFDKEEKGYANVIVLYTHDSLKKITMLSDDEFRKEIKYLNQVCSLK